MPVVWVATENNNDEERICHYLNLYAVNVETSSRNWCAVPVSLTV